MTTIPQAPIDELRRDVGDVITADDPRYEAARTVFYALREKMPAAIVRPTDAHEVAAAVSFAREHGLEVAVRSGGHSAAGHGTSDGGVVIDLAALRALSIDADRRIASAETGLTSGEVTGAAAAHGLGISFGDTASVGIGGLTLGGGVGYLVRKHGLTIDHLRGADVVTADGALLRADTSENADLFWALRGGGGNFGVATRFEYELHPVEAVTGGMLVLPATPDVIAEFLAAAAAAPDELSTIANVMRAPPMPFLPAEVHGELVVLAMLVHVGSDDDGARAIAPFRSLAPALADLVRPLELPEIYPPDDPEYRPVFAARTMFVDEVDRDVAAAIIERLSAPSSAQMRVAQLRTLGGAMARVSPDATAFAHRQSKVMVNLAALFGDAAEAPVQEAWVDTFASDLRQSDAGAYVNFLGDEGGERVRAAYPGKTWDRLVEIKRRYDPTNLFRLNQNIPPDGAE